MTAAESLESSLINCNHRGLSDCQILILLVLARFARPMRLCELAAEVKRHRQTVVRSIDCFSNDELRIDRPSRVVSIVHLQQPGINLLIEVLNTKTLEKKAV